MSGDGMSITTTSPLSFPPHGEGEEKRLTLNPNRRWIVDWKDAQEKASETCNWPPNIAECEKRDYIRMTATILFNESHGSNRDYTELLKDARHRIIADCLTRNT